MHGPGVFGLPKVERWQPRQVTFLVFLGKSRINPREKHPPRDKHPQLVSHALFGKTDFACRPKSLRLRNSPPRPGRPSSRFRGVRRVRAQRGASVPCWVMLTPDSSTRRFLDWTWLKSDHSWRGTPPQKNWGVFLVGCPLKPI